MDAFIFSHPTLAALLIVASAWAAIDALMAARAKRGTVPLRNRRR